MAVAAGHATATTGQVRQDASAIALQGLPRPYGSSSACRRRDAAASRREHRRRQLLGQVLVGDRPQEAADRRACRPRVKRLSAVAGNGPPCTIAWPTSTPVGQPLARMRPTLPLQHRQQPAAQRRDRPHRGCSVAVNCPSMRSGRFDHRRRCWRSGRSSEAAPNTSWPKRLVGLEAARHRSGNIAPAACCSPPRPRRPRPSVCTAAMAVRAVRRRARRRHGCPASASIQRTFPPSAASTWARKASRSGSVDRIDRGRDWCSTGRHRGASRSTKPRAIASVAFGKRRRQDGRPG